MENKFRLSFATMCSVAFITLFCVLVSSCNNDDLNTTAPRFNQNLLALNTSQESLLNSIITRAGSDKLSMDDALSIAEKLDCNVQTFKQENIKALSTIENLSSDEIKLMSLDSTYFLSFIRENFSEKTYNYTCDYLKGNLSVTTMQILSDEKLTSTEKTYISNLKTASGFIELMAKVEFGETTIRTRADKKQTKEDICLDDYAGDLAGCALDFALGAATGATVGPWGAFAVGAVSYAKCAYDAKQTFNRCMR